MEQEYEEDGEYGTPPGGQGGFDGETPEAGPEFAEPSGGPGGFDETPPGAGFDGAEAEEEERFETADITGFKPGAPSFDRKKVTMVLCAVFALVLSGGFVTSLAKNKKESGESGSGARAAGTPSFLKSERDRAMAGNGGGSGEAGELAAVPPGADPAEPAGLPGVSWDGGRAGGTEMPGQGYPESVPAGGNASAPPPPPSSGASRQGGSAPAAALPAHYYSPFVPQRIEGSLFGPGGGGTGQGAAGQDPSSPAARYPYLTAETAGQNAADEFLRQAAARNAAAPEQARNTGGQDFYNSSGGGGALNGGFFLGDNALWPGTVIPGILETAVNTDLPGSVIARTTRNVYDSRTGKKLLIPQGSLLVARYNSSVSYAQSRVQIVWDTLVRPDGFYIELEGMNGVDKKGMSGQEAEYHENWFEYAKAAGIIAMFSVAASKMTEEAAKHASASTVSGIAQANSEFVSEAGGNIVSRAMNIQPSLTVENGTIINIMLNRAVYLPPAEDYPAAQKYTLK